MDDPFVKDFLKSYKVKKIDFTPYLELDKLKQYIAMDKDKNDLRMLIPFHTYIKYIKDQDAFQNENYKSHVHTGGIFVSGGFYESGKFIKSRQTKEWTHIVIKKVSFPTGQVKDANNKIKNVYDNESHIYKLTLKDYYLFYKHF